MVHVQCNSEATLTGDSSFLNGYARITIPYDGLTDTMTIVQL